jgi:hypothetical protein
MKNISRNIPDPRLLSAVFVTAVLCFLKFHAATLLDFDEYFHLAVSRIIMHGHFPQSLPFKFSMLGDFYADKDLLLHIIAVPFLFLCKNPVTAAKCTTVLMDAALATAMYAIMARYAGKTASAVLTLGLLSSPLFITYALYMRPATLAILFTVSGLYFMAEKRNIPLLITAMLFALAHISAFTLVFFALLCEGLRKLFYNEFHHDTIAYTFLGLAAGYMIHPNFPLNLATTYINAVLAPLYSHVPGLNTFGGELMPANGNEAMGGAAIIFLLSGFMFWTMFLVRPRISLQTMLFTAAAQIYFVLAMGALRFWHQAVPLALLAAAAFWGDCRREEAQGNSLKIRIVAWTWVALTAVLVLTTIPKSYKAVDERVPVVAPVVEAAQWLHGKLKPGTLIYHTLWSDSHALLLYAPEYNYISALDPVYMMYGRPQLSAISDKLMAGLISDPVKTITTTFGTQYVFTSKGPPFYAQVRAMPGVETLYENNNVAVFRLNPATSVPNTAKNGKPGRHK